MIPKDKEQIREILKEIVTILTSDVRDSAKYEKCMTKLKEWK